MGHEAEKYTEEELDEILKRSIDLNLTIDEGDYIAFIEKCQSHDEIDFHPGWIRLVTSAETPVKLPDGGYSVIVYTEVGDRQFSSTQVVKLPKEADLFDMCYPGETPDTQYWRGPMWHHKQLGLQPYHSGWDVSGWDGAKRVSVSQHRRRLIAMIQAIQGVIASK
jgi:hypothetical protein